jgi:hypothetical protein
MTAELLGDWLDRALSEVPQELAVRIRGSLPANWRDVSLNEGATVMADAAAHELEGLLERGCETRWAAPGLLTVDALVTYACELVALSGEDIDGSALRIADTVAKVLTTRDVP